MLDRVGYVRPAIITRPRSPFDFVEGQNQLRPELESCYSSLGLLLRVFRLKIRELVVEVQELLSRTDVEPIFSDRLACVRQLVKFRAELLILDLLAHRLQWQSQSVGVRVLDMPWCYAFSRQAYGTLSSSAFVPLQCFLQENHQILRHMVEDDVGLVRMLNIIQLHHRSPRHALPRMGVPRYRRAIPSRDFNSTPEGLFSTRLRCLSAVNQTEPDDPSSPQSGTSNALRRRSH